MLIKHLFRVVLLSLVFASLACNSTATTTTTATPSEQQPITASAAPAMNASALSATDPALVAGARKTVEQLASEQFEGRGVGTKGIDLAADYIAKRFESLGLKRLPGEDDYFQQFDFVTSTTISDDTTLSLNGKTLTRRQQFAPAGFSAEAAFDAPIAFVGYGISDAKDLKYDDYAGIDVKGKVVLAMRYEPRDEQGKSRITGGGDDDWSSSAALTAKASAAEEHGAIVLLLVNPPNELGGTLGPATRPAAIPASLTSASAATQPAQPTTAPSDPDPLMSFGRTSMGGRAAIPIMQIKQAEADALLAAAGAEKLANLQAKIDAANKPASFEIKNSKATGSVVLKRNVAEVKNVMAMLPGHGPRAEEYVVVGAHYDHLGRGMLGSMVPGSQEIHYGADDNASGTAALIEVAGNLVRVGRNDRSIIFIAFTAEEEGLIGSQYFVDHPPVPLSKISAMLNMDMVGRIKNHKLFVGGAGTAPAFEPMVRAADVASPLELPDSGDMVGKGGMGPSDHQTFALKKIPVLYFFSGVHEDYHRPTDTADKINYEGVAQSISLAQFFVSGMSTMPKQEYVDEFDKTPMMAHRGGGGASLGVIPDYMSAESTTGVRINGTRPDSAAAKAGLKEGDVITELGDHKISNIYNLTDALGKLKPGQKVKIIVKRGDHQVEMDAIMGAPRGG